MWLASLLGLFLVLSGLSLVLLRRLGAEHNSRLSHARNSGLGGVVIALLLGIGVIQMTSWLALPIIAAFAGVGLLLYNSGWPRLPLFVGVIAGPTVEGNYLSAVNVVSSQIEIVMRPIVLVLIVVVIAIALASHRIANAKAPTVAGAPTRQSLGTAALQWQNIVPLLGVAAGIAFF